MRKVLANYVRIIHKPPKCCCSNNEIKNANASICSQCLVSLLAESWHAWEMFSLFEFLHTFLQGSRQHNEIGCIQSHSCRVWSAEWRASSKYFSAASYSRCLSLMASSASALSCHTQYYFSSISYIHGRTHLGIALTALSKMQIPKKAIWQQNHRLQMNWCMWIPEGFSDHGNIALKGLASQLLPWNSCESTMPLAIQQSIRKEIAFVSKSRTGGRSW